MGAVPQFVRLVVPLGVAIGAAALGGVPIAAAVVVVVVLTAALAAEPHVPGRWSRPLRGALCVAIAIGTVGLSSLKPAEADPEVCGYVRYGTHTTDTTTTVPYLTYCALPCGSAVFVGVPPGNVGDVRWEAFVCVRGI